MDVPLPLEAAQRARTHMRAQSPEIEQGDCREPSSPAARGSEGEGRGRRALPAHARAIMPQPPLLPFLSSPPRLSSPPPSRGSSTSAGCTPARVPVRAPVRLLVYPPIRTFTRPSARRGAARLPARTARPPPAALRRSAPVPPGMEPHEAPLDPHCARPARRSARPSVHKGVRRHNARARARSRQVGVHAACSTPAACAPAPRSHSRSWSRACGRVAGSRRERPGSSPH